MIKYTDVLVYSSVNSDTEYVHTPVATPLMHTFSLCRFPRQTCPISSIIID